jgi:mannose-1-phosphate guanylyltransferase
LLPVLGEPILAHTLRELAAAGCEAVAINLHHRGEEIRRVLGEHRAGLPITWSEEPRILGTLGALAPLRSFLGEADLVLLVNGDSLCRWPFEQLVARHLARRAAVTLLLATRPDTAELGGGVGVDRQGRVVSLRTGGIAVGPAIRRAVFAGAHVLSPHLLSAVPSGPADIVRDLYEPMLGRGEILHSLSTSRRWHDLGTPERYRLGVLDWARGRWISQAAEVAPGARVAASVVEAGAVVETGAVVRETVILPGARIGRGATIERCVVGFGASVAPLARERDRMLTASEGRDAC